MSRQSNSYSGTVLGFFRPVVGCVRTMGRYHGPRPTRSACVQHGAGGDDDSSRPSIMQRSSAHEAMRVVVFGAGAVGGHLAARLAAHGSAAGIEVAAVARGVELEAMNPEIIERIRTLQHALS